MAGPHAEIPTLNSSRTRSSTRSTAWSRQHAFTTSQVLPIDKKGRPTVSFDAVGQDLPGRHQRDLPLSTIYGFNGTFPGPMINAEYGKPALVRFANHLDENPLGPGPAGLRRPGLLVPDPPAQRAHRAGERRQPALLDALRAAAHRLPVRAVGRQAVPELAGRRRRPGEAELLLVPRPPDGPHRLQRLQGHGRALPDLRPEADGRQGRHGHGRRAPGAAAARACAPTTPTAPSTSSTTSRWPSSTAGSTTASRSTRTSTTPRASSRPRRTRPPTRSGGARRSTSTSPATASSATSSPSTAPPTRCWRSSGASTGSGSWTPRSPGSTSSS